MQQQEYLLQLQLLEQQANQFGEQINAVNQQIEELKKLKENLSKLEDSSEKEIFSEIAKGIYLKSKIEKKEILVDVGSKIFVPKSFNDIRAIIDEQISKFEEVKPKIEEEIKNINKHLDKVIAQAREQKKSEQTPEKKQVIEKKAKGKK